MSLTVLESLQELTIVAGFFVPAKHVDKLPLQPYCGTCQIL
jgi:hypothetical protein